jgi:hypothetical protein
MRYSETSSLKECWAFSEMRRESGAVMFGRGDTEPGMFAHRLVGVSKFALGARD